MRDETRHSAAALAAGVAESLSDEEIVKGNKMATVMADDIRSLAEAVESPEEMGVLMAQSIAYILAALQVAHVKDLTDLLDTNMVGYSLAAGVLAGTWQPGDGESEPGEESKVSPSKVVLSDEWRRMLDEHPEPQIGQYL